MALSTILFSYDVEVCDPARAHITREFLAAAARVHAEADTPCTMFVCGKTLEMNDDAFRRLAGDPLYDFQSHTYLHSMVKTAVQWYKGEHVGDPNRAQVLVYRGASAERLRDEVARTKRLLADIVGSDNIGLRSPCGCYFGLLDRPELLEMLWDLGIRYVSTYHHRSEDFEHWDVLPPHPEEIIQPFWYSQIAQKPGQLPAGEPPLEDHLPDMLEFPLLGAVVDCTWKDKYGYDAYEQYLNSTKVVLDVVARENLVLSYVQHDWSSVKGDPEMAYTQAIIRYAQERGLEITPHTEFYRRLARQRERMTP